MITSDANQIVINALPVQVWNVLVGDNMLKWQHKTAPYPPITAMGAIPTPQEPEEAIGQVIRMTGADGGEIDFYITEYNPPRWLTIAGERVVTPLTTVTYINWQLEPHGEGKTLLTMSIELDIRGPWWLKIAATYLSNTPIGHIIEITLENISRTVDDTVLAANEEAVL